MVSRWFAARCLVYVGECGETFTSGADSKENADALRAHYMQKFGRGDHRHMQFFRRHSERLTTPCFCGVCDDLFSRPVDLFRHIASKIRNKNEMDCLIHTGYFEAIVLPFVGTKILCCVFSLGDSLDDLPYLFCTWLMFTDCCSYLLT